MRLIAPARSFRGPGESKPPDGFWFFCTGAKEQSCKTKFLAIKQLGDLQSKFSFMLLKLKIDFLHNLTYLKWANAVKKSIKNNFERKDIK